MKKRNIIRLSLCLVAVIGVFVVVGLSSGLFAFWANGYDSYFDSQNYVRRAIIVKPEYSEHVLTESKTITFSSVSAFDVQKAVSADADVFIDREASSVTVTVKNKGTFSYSAIFSCLTPEKSGTSNGTPEEDSRVATTVYFIKGDEKYECTLSAYEFTKKQSVYVFTAQTPDGFDKVLISGIMVSEFKRR